MAETKEFRTIGQRLFAAAKAAANSNGWTAGGAVRGAARAAAGAAGHRPVRKRPAISIKALVAAWPTITEPKEARDAGIDPLIGSKLTVREETDKYGVLSVQLRGGMTIQKVGPCIPSLESVFDAAMGEGGAGVAPAAITVMRDQGRASRLILRVLKEDPLSVVPEFPEDQLITDISQAMPIGIREDGSVVKLRLHPKMGESKGILIGGRKGSGKSTGVHVLMTHVSNCENACPIGADLMHGKEFNLWKRSFHQVATERGEAAAMLSGILEVVDERGRELARRGIQSWKPTPEEPALVFFIDELADLSEWMGQVFEICRKCRAVAVIPILATQRPTASALGDGGTDMRAQLDTVIGLRARVDDTSVIFGPGSINEGWGLDKLGGPGSFKIRSDDDDLPYRARFWNHSPAAIRRAAARARRPNIDQLTHEAYERGWLRGDRVN
jgi:hypothetical protein